MRNAPYPPNSPNRPRLVALLNVVETLAQGPYKTKFNGFVKHYLTQFRENTLESP